jgi:hypothetical protein
MPYMFCCTAMELGVMANEASGTSPEQIANAQRELRIREKAYELWQMDGSPEGKPDEYWHRARQIIENEAMPDTSAGSEKK